MTYCINPRCNHRQNQNNAEQCQNCGTPLLIHHRYRLIRPLRDLDRDYNAEIFEVVDCEDEYRRKILKILAKRDPYFIELFQQEQTLLTQFQHPGIPRGEAAFKCTVSNNGAEFNLHCLVMERIEGADLEDWIQANPPANGSMNESTVIDWLKQIAEILNYVHQEDFFHRDIKPSNIMRRNTGRLVLIDFGTARNVSQTVVDGRSVTIIQSMGYTAPEQLVGKAVPESDFYALGRTFVYLLTGKHPDTITPPESWRQQTQTMISEPLKDLIDLLMAQEPTDRPQNLPELLNKIQQHPANGNKTTQLPATLVQSSSLASPPKNKSPILRIKKSLIASGIGLVGLFATIMMIRNCVVIPPDASTANAETCDKNVEDLLSCGEQIFLPTYALDSEKEAPSEKAAGAKAFQAGRYPEAQKLFEQALSISNDQEKPDPETLIYRNNVDILLKKRKEPELAVYTLAIAAPLDKAPDDTASEIGISQLRGVAMVQQQAINSGLNVQVVIANDANRIESAQLIAEKLGQRSQVLGVVGHYASEVTKEVLSLYKKSRLPLVSGTSTSTGLSISKLVQDNYFFRTVSTTQQAAQKLANYTVYEAKQKKAFALYDFKPEKEFSHTIGNSFKQSFTDLGGTIVKEFNLSKPLNYTSILKEAQKSGAVLALFPSGHTDDSFENMLQLVEYNAANGGHLWIVGGNPLYNSELLRSLEKISQNQTVRLDRLAVVVDWHYAKSPSKEFVQEARVFWKGDVGWRTATTYDAAKVFIAAIEKSLLNNSTPSRQGIRDIIAARDFLTTGATGKIQFDGSDRPNARTYLLKVSKSCKGNGYIFVPIDAPTSCSSSPYGNIDSMP